jgi:hypothetical protein
MNNKDMSTLIGPIVRGFKKYNLTIFIVILVGGLASAVLILNSALQQSSNTTDYQVTTTPTTFDQPTINRVKQLHTSSDSTTTIALPSGRINPFSE